MISVRELRLRNWVYSYDDKKPWQVTWLEDDGTEIDPIPLTPEILEKAGFKDRSSLSDFCFINGDVIIGGTMKRLFPSVWGESGLEAFGEEIKYVHQLQNLYFALTGTELEIKL